LWEHRVNFDECRSTLKSIAGVAQDTIDRLSAEFRGEDFHASFVALDLEAWKIAFAEGSADSGPAGSSTFKGPAYAKKGAMLDAIMRYFAGLGLVFVAKEWRQVVLKAQTIKERMLSSGEHVGASTPSEDRSWRRASTLIDNRHVWRRTLDQGHVPKKWERVARFHLAFWNGSGATERGLGADADTQGEHVGTIAAQQSEEDAYANSGLLELRREGPQCEEDVFTRSDDGVLLLTDWSRGCAQEWLTTHGRRFCSRGSVLGAKRDRILAASTRKTDKGVQLRARAAYALRRTMAQEDEEVHAERETILGVDRARLATEVRRTEKAPAGKKLMRFRHDTLLLRSEKVGQTWAGFSGEPPKLRLGGDAAIRAASASRAQFLVDARSALARRAGVRRPRQAEVVQTAKATPAASASCSSGPAAPTAKPAAKPAASTPCSSKGPAAPAAKLVRKSSALASTQCAPAALSSKTSLEDVCHKNAHPVELITWLGAILLGKQVCVDETVRKFKPLLKSGLHINVTQSFALKHKGLWRSMRSFASRPGSNLTVQQTTKDGIADKKGLVTWMMRNRLEA